ncbi:hypothetical protein OHA72_04340 [Dactylosporangium sp. NBC_01737]|uniref:hypothetical protein n=1 Tax=Dactylosporangium sp. NBC_01737 TaxID=2975959 RepID=UPI002E12EC81|nr:hypothetical protein OHA72_04340 [Dactylosporangium sp. NBC_01737]
MKRHWIIAGTAAWALVIAGLAYYSSRNDPPTSRDQTTIADGLPVVDTALARVAAALDPATSVTALGGYTRTDQSCRVTSAREGTRFERVLLVYVKKDTEPAVLDRVHDALPAAYQSHLVSGPNTHVLTADAGDFVTLRGAVVQPGQVRFTADTGCRVQDAAVKEATPQSQTANRAPVQAVLDTLKQSASQWRTHRLVCPGGGILWTVEAVTTGDGAAARSTVPATAVVLDEPKLFAFRAGEAGVALRVESDALRITSTAGC